MKIRGLGSLAFGVLLIFFCVAIMGIGIQHIGGYIDVPGLAITFGIAGGYLLLAFGLSDLLGAASVAVTGRVRDEKSALKAIEVCRAAAYTSIISGIIGMMIGLINMLSHGMDDPTVLSCGAAVALLTVLYGVVAAGLFYVLEGRCRIALLNVPSPASNEAFAASDKEEKVKRPLDDKALAVSGKLELVIEESGIKIVDNSAQDRPQDNK